MTSSFTPARKGDLVVVRRIGDGSGSFRADVLIRWYVGRVTKVDREGYVREFEYPSFGAMQRQEIGGKRGHGWGGGLDPNGVFVESQARVNVPALLRAVAGHTYEGHPLQPKPFDTLEEATAFLRAAL